MRVVVFALLCLFVVGCVAPPVTEQKKKKHDKEGPEDNEIEEQAFDVEYKRYLQEVVNVLENDEDFKTRLTKADPEDIKSGNIAKEIEFVNHNVRSKLDELKRQELERLRQAAMRQYEHDNGIDRKHMKIPAHLDPNNPHTFEAEDLRKLIVQTTKDLETADKKRKEEFKEYEMHKELEYQEQLKKMDEKNRGEAEKQHQQQLDKHKKHDPLHHPGSKPQLEQVWEEQDRMSPEDFNPKTFFHLHDLDGNGYWDATEVKALFRKELDKMYDPNAPEDDIKERFEEMERMREHVFNETDVNKDQLISFQEFLDQTKKQEFERDEGWEPLDQHTQYTQDEYQQYARSHEDEIRRMIEQGLIPPAPPGYVPVILPPEAQHHAQMQGLHPQQLAAHAQGHHIPPPGVHPNAIPHGQGYHPQDPQHFQAQQGYHPQQGQQGQVPYHPAQGIPQQHHQQQFDHHQQQLNHHQQQQLDHHQQQQLDHHQQQQLDHHQQQQQAYHQPQLGHHEQQVYQQPQGSHHAQQIQHEAIPQQYNPPVASHQQGQVQQHQQIASEHHYPPVAPPQQQQHQIQGAPAGTVNTGSQGHVPVQQQHQAQQDVVVPPSGQVPAHPPPPQNAVHQQQAGTH